MLSCGSVYYLCGRLDVCSHRLLYTLRFIDRYSLPGTNSPTQNLHYQQKTKITPRTRIEALAMLRASQINGIYKNRWRSKGRTTNIAIRNSHYAIPAGTLIKRSKPSTKNSQQNDWLTSFRLVFSWAFAWALLMLFCWFNIGFLWHVIIFVYFVTAVSKEEQDERKLHYNGYSDEFLDRLEPNGNIPAGQCLSTLVFDFLSEVIL